MKKTFFLQIAMLSTLCIAGCANPFALPKINFYIGLSEAPTDSPAEFGVNGVARAGFAMGGVPSSEYAYAHAIQSDGKIVVAGDYYGSGAADFALIRYNPDGSLDTTFGGTGKVSTDIGTDAAGAIAIQSDGKIVTAGSSNVSGSNDFALIRYNPNGSLDTTFGGTGKVVTDIGTASTDYAAAIAIQADGKIVTAGSADASGSFDFALVRYNPDGSLDTTFGGTGKVLTDIGTISNDFAYGIAIQSDGKIVIAGISSASGSSDFALVRYNPDGSLDTTFGGTGKVLTELGTASTDFANTIAIQTDGKIVAAGSSNASGSFDFALVRYNPDGSLDTTFGGTGKVLTELGTASSDFVNAIAIQADGKIAAAGSSDASGSNNFALVRYNPDGSLDTTFGGTGKVLTDIGTASNDSAYSIAIQSDAKIVAAGSADASGSFDFALVRYNPDGSLDTTFGGTGKVSTDIGTASNDFAAAIAIQADGKIVAVGSSNASGSSDFALVRYSPDGSLDTTFGGTGKVLTDIGTASNDSAAAITIQADGKIVAVGSSNASGSSDFALVRYSPDGSLDTTFGGTGKVLTDIGTTSNDLAAAIAIQADGKIVAAGSSNVSGSSDFALVRYSPDGSLDTTFGGTGKVLTDIGTASSDFVSAIAIQADGKIVAAGSSDASGSNNFALVRYNPDGSLDTTFGGTGKVLTDIGTASTDFANTIAIQADGKIVAAGSSNASGSSDFALVRYNLNGSLDMTFGGTGKVLTELGTTSNDLIYGIAIQADGKIVAAGSADASGSNNFALVRYNPDGSLDTTFGGTGKVLTDIGTASNDSAAAIAIQSDGKMLTAGKSSNLGGTNDFILVRYNQDGSK